LAIALASWRTVNDFPSGALNVIVLSSILCPL
jgi:hypothetical protein